MVRKGYAVASILYAGVVLGLGCATAASLQPPAVQSGYAPVNGLKMYYEAYGRANAKIPPLVLLHGGGSTIETSFGKVLPARARGRQVIAFEQQGHGRTADIVDRPFTFEQSADDTAGLMFRLFPNARLAVLPGTDHMTIVNRSDWLVPMIETFLDSPMPPTRSKGDERR